MMPEDRIPPEIKATMDAMTEADKVYFATVEAAYGKNLACILSECANLVMLRRIFPPMDKVVNNLIHHVVDAFNIPAAETVAILQRFTELRTISRCPPSKLN